MRDLIRDFISYCVCTYDHMGKIWVKMITW